MKSVVIALTSKLYRICKFAKAINVSRAILGFAMAVIAPRFPIPAFSAQITPQPVTPIAGWAQEIGF